MWAFIAYANSSSYTIELVNGESTSIESDFLIGDIAILNDKICDYLVSPDRKSIYFSAKKMGETIFTYWDQHGLEKKEYILIVYDSQVKTVFDDLVKTFGSIPGLTIKISHGRIEISGIIMDPELYGQLAALTKNNPLIHSNIILKNDIMKSRVNAIKNSIAYPSIKVRAVNDTIILEGIAYSDYDARRAAQIASLHSHNIMNLIDIQEIGRSIADQELIEISIHMMEIKRSALKSLGLNWAPGSISHGESIGNISSNGNPSLGQSVFGFITGLFPKIKWLRQKGHARILEKPSIIVKNGEKGYFFSGIEIPYGDSSNTKFKKVGIELTVHPVLTGNEVDIDIQGKLSAPSVSMSGSVDMHEIKTISRCKLNSSMILGNVVHLSRQNMRNRIPKGTSSSSALFTLFLSKDYQNNESEFIIAITPRRVGSQNNTKEQQLLNLLSDTSHDTRLEKKYRAPKSRLPKKRTKKSPQRRWR